VCTTRVKWKGLLLFGDCRNVEVYPSAFLQQRSCKIVDMETLHQQDDCTFLFVIKTRHKCRLKPACRSGSGNLGHDVLRLLWIVDDEQIASPPSQTASE